MMVSDKEDYEMNYIQDNLTEFFNAIIRCCTTVTGDDSLLPDVFKDIISLQYDSINKTVFIETETYNYVLVEVGKNLRLSEFRKVVDLSGAGGV